MKRVKILVVTVAVVLGLLGVAGVATAVMVDGDAVVCDGTDMRPGDTCEVEVDGRVTRLHYGQMRDRQKDRGPVVRIVFGGLGALLLLGSAALLRQSRREDDSRARQIAAAQEWTKGS